MFILALKTFFNGYASLDPKEYLNKIFLWLGDVYYLYSRNLLFAKKYYSKCVSSLNLEERIRVLKNLGDICTDLGHLDEALIFSKKSLEISSTLNKNEKYLIDNLKSLAIVYAEQNNFKEAKTYFKNAIKKALSTHLHNKKEILADLYGRLGTLYSIRYLSSPLSAKGEKYVLKGLNLLKANKLFSASLIKGSSKISCETTRNKTRLGEILCKRGLYKRASTEGFKEAQYIIDNQLDNCTHSLTKARILLGEGEVSLRIGKLEDAEEKLTKSLKLARLSVGEGDTIKIKSLRAEARLRLNKINEAYKDCTSVQNLAKTRSDIYHQTLNLNSLYTMCLIELKKSNKISFEKFSSLFLKESLKICRSFLSIKDFEFLQKKQAFSPSSDFSSFFKKSYLVYCSLYGKNHPFVKDYIQPQTVELDFEYLNYF